jgi:hypothetical protein
MIAKVIIGLLALHFMGLFFTSAHSKEVSLKAMVAMPWELGQRPRAHRPKLAITIPFSPGLGPAETSSNIAAAIPRHPQSPFRDMPSSRKITGPQAQKRIQRALRPQITRSRKSSKKALKKKAPVKFRVPQYRSSVHAMDREDRELMVSEDYMKNHEEL